MAQKSGFFNAIQSAIGVYDRKYNANDYSDILAVIIGNGVKRSENDDLKVTASGMIVSVNVGFAMINGHYYHNDTPYSFAAITPPSGGNRYDRVMLRLNTAIAERSISLVYVQGTAASTPTKPAPTRSGDVYDLVLADIYVATNASNLVVTDTRDDREICGWVYSVVGDEAFFTSLDNAFYEWFNAKKDTLSSVTLFKKYSQIVSVTSGSTSRVSFNIPQYDADTCFVEVYVNGILDNRHTISGNIITFEGSLVAGTQVTVNVYKSIDGTDIMTVADEITELQNRVDAMDGISRFAYKCTGLNDNISLSEIAQAIYAGSYTVGTLSNAAEAFLSGIGGNTYLASLSAEAQVTIDVVGRLGATTPAAGSGTTASRYRYFNIGIAGEGDKRVIFDFAKCDKITIGTAANTNSIIFYGTDLNIRNANVYAYSNGANSIITMIAGSNNRGNMTFENCRFSVSAQGDACIATNGNFTNCYCVVKSLSGDAVCFDAKTESLIRLNVGTYYAYIGRSTMTAAIMRIASNETNGVIMADNINAPTVSITNYAQKNLAVANSGNIYVSGVCSTMTSTGTTATITGQIWKSKR